MQPVSSLFRPALLQRSPCVQFHHGSGFNQLFPVLFRKYPPRHFTNFRCNETGVPLVSGALSGMWSTSIRSNVSGAEACAGATDGPSERSNQRRIISVSQFFTTIPEKSDYLFVPQSARAQGSALKRRGSGPWSETCQSRSQLCCQAI